MKKVFFAVLVVAFTVACCFGIVLFNASGVTPSVNINGETGGAHVDVKDEELETAPPTIEDPSDEIFPPLEEDPSDESDIEEHRHSAVNTAEVKATCTEFGTIEFWYCHECGSYFSDEELTNEIEESELIIAPAGHTPVTDSAVEATCTASGLTEGCHCSVCGEVIVAQTEIEPVGHKYDDGICENCGEWAVSEGLSFTAAGDGYAVSGLGSCTAKFVRITDVYDGKPVVEISPLAFESAPITGIYIPASVRVIGMCAFCNSELYTVYFEDGDAEIGEMTFYECSSLFSVRLPDGLQKLSSSLFYGCASLKEITIPESVQVIEELAFAECTSLEEIIIPANVQNVKIYAFQNCAVLNKVIYYGSPTVDDDAFIGCPLAPRLAWG